MVEGKLRKSTVVESRYMFFGCFFFRVADGNEGNDWGVICAINFLGTKLNQSSSNFFHRLSLNVSLMDSLWITTTKMAYFAVTSFYSNWLTILKKLLRANSPWFGLAIP